MRNFYYSLLVFLLTAHQTALGSDSKPIPRKIVALYTKDNYDAQWFSKVLQYAATPIEHNGVVVEYHNVLEKFPNIKNRDDILGAVIWDLYTLKGKQWDEYLDWAVESIEAGKKIVMLETVPGQQKKLSYEQQQKLDRFWEKAGVSNEGWEHQSLKAQFAHKDPILMDFERQFTGIKPGYFRMKIISDQVTTHLFARDNNNPKSDSCLIFTGPNASYIADGFALFKTFYETRDYLSWYINPFYFFRLAFDTDKIPKPDTTTLAGRRMYYSHIDGDGWNSLSQIEEYWNEREIAAGVILKEIVEPNPSLPVTVGAVIADLDPSWAGIPRSVEVAEEFYKLPQVEIGCHTWSHPFDWGFFEHYTPESEIRYFPEYKFGVWTEKNDDEDDEKNKMDLLETEFKYPKEIHKGYDVPRAYANKPYDLKREIQGSLNFLKELSKNTGKLPQLMQWSGNCLPYLEALKETRLAGALNINGGDTRFDNEFSSLAWVRPLGMNVGDELQVFTSMANENLYTDLWSHKFYGFNRLFNTIKNTNTPFRLRPINLYYHTYSGEKLASLLALKQNLEFIKKQQIIPVKTTEFVKIVHGFYSAQIIPLESDRWQIANRGELQTIRFDYATFMGVDFSRSKGVVGQRHHHGNLYVYLDKAVESPVIAVTPIDAAYKEPITDTPYLIESRWQIENLQRKEKQSWSFNAYGYGDGEMTWSVPVEGSYEIRIGESKRTEKSLDNLLQFTISENALDPIQIEIKIKS